MELFKKNRQADYTIIIGCGRLGANLANTLSEEGGNVLIIDQDKDAFRKLSPSFGGLTLCGNGMDFDLLKEAQMNHADVIVAVTNSDNVNVLIAQIAREVYHAKRVIARLYDPERECVYREFGINTICPAALSAIAIDQILSRPVVEDKQEAAQ